MEVIYHLNYFCGRKLYFTIQQLFVLQLKVITQRG